MKALEPGAARLPTAASPRSARPERPKGASRPRGGAARPARGDGGPGGIGSAERGEAARALDGPPGGYGGARRGWSTPRRGIRLAVGSGAMQVFERVCSLTPASRPLSRERENCGHRSSTRRALGPRPALDPEALLRRVAGRGARDLAVLVDQDEGGCAAHAVGLEGAARLVDRDGGGEGAGEFLEEGIELLGGLVGDRDHLHVALLLEGEQLGERRLAGPAPGGPEEEEAALPAAQPVGQRAAVGRHLERGRRAPHRGRAGQLRKADRGRESSIILTENSGSSRIPGTRR